jgi:hypothetical protein
MKQIAGWKTGLFVGALALLAFVLTVREEYRPNVVPPASLLPPREEKAKPPPVNSPADDSKVIQDKLALAKLAAEERAAEHARFLTRNINPGFTRAASPTLAVIAITGDGKLNSQLTSNLIRRLATNGVGLVSSFFTPGFVSDGNFKKLANGSNILRRTGRSAIQFRL